MRKTIGPVVVIDTKPPYREWDGNQATYLFFPIFAAFFLVLMSGLSEPIIDGLNMVKVDTGVNGTLTFGTWGFCLKNSPGVDGNFCSGDRAFGGNMIDIDRLPESLATYKDLVHVIPSSYLIANGVFHLLGALAAWLSVTWTLAASGSWHNKEEHAWSWTRFSFHGTGASSLFILIGWGLDLGMVTRISGKAINIDGSQPKVTPGPAVWMMMAAFMLCLVTWIVRLTYLRRLPRPFWSIKGAGGDFHNAMPPPMSAALPPPEDHPPTWESLDIESDAAVAIDEKEMMDQRDYANLEAALAESEQPSVEQKGFIV